MDYPLRFVDQLRPHLKALRKQRGLTQAQAGALIGVSQARVAEIEANPGAVSFEQLMKLLSALGASFCLRDEAAPSRVLVAAEEAAQYDAVKLPPGPWTATQMSDQSVLVRLEAESPGAPGESLRALQALNPGKEVKPHVAPELRRAAEEGILVTQALDAWMNGERVGTWFADRGAHAFRYDPAWLESPRRRSLSLSIPLNSTLEVRGDVVRNYFDNLLPDNDRIRARLRNRFRLKDATTFGLLEAIGRDCVGAVQLLPEGAVPEGWNAINCEPLDDAQIAELLQAVPSEDAPQGMRDEDLFRISLAGAQEKTALTRWNGAWCRPHGATPTTHIVKLPLGLIGGSRRVDASDSVQNEWLCAQIVEALGLPVAPTSMATFGGQTVLMVERFDREWMDGGTWIARLPQEDFCQALGLPSDKKYEQHGGPGMPKCLQLLQGSRSADDGMRFLLAQLAFFLLAATDGHAKNFSIHLQRGDAYEMTPLYDVISMWPYFGDGANQFQPRKAGLAMAVRSRNTHYVFQTIQARHWHGLAMKNGGIDVWNAMLGLVASVDAALDEVEALLPPGFPARTWQTISQGMRGEAKRFLAGLEGLAA